MAKTYIFGHKNPDTDAISSAIIMADFEQQTGNTDATPYRLGEVGPETQYALNHFNVDTPELLSDDLNNQNVILVDHNEFQKVLIQLISHQFNMSLTIIEFQTLKLQDHYITVLSQ